MAYFAELDNNNIVLQVIYVVNDVLKDELGVEQEQLGIDFCKQLYGQDTNWLQTSFNARIRGHFAGIGFLYDVDRNAFIPPKPAEYPSWVLNEQLVWDPPIPYPFPNEGQRYDWDEATQSYVENTTPQETPLPLSYGTQDF
jgi:hypothetical protein